MRRVCELIKCDICAGNAGKLTTPYFLRVYLQVKNDILVNPMLMIIYFFQVQQLFLV